jgi:hypothetical protein
MQLTETATPTTRAPGASFAQAVIGLGRRLVIDVPTIILMVRSCRVVWKTTRGPEPFLVLEAAVIGVMIAPCVGHTL